MKKILIPIGTLLITGMVHAQLSPTENYVYSKTYLDYNTSNVATKTSETVQYFDGLGRPKQVVNIKASPQGKDVVTPIEYDGFGRQVKDYLPIPQSNTLNGAIVPTPLANATQPGIYGQEKIYAEKTLENSPLDRLLEQKQVGTAWNDKPVKFQYDANIHEDYVRKYKPTTTWDPTGKMTVTKIELLEYFLPNTLYKNTVTDEDGNKTIEFKNGKGQVVLVRKVISPTENADTYYVYNEYNQLAFVIPPGSPATPDDTALNNFCYQYRYDGKSRLVEKKLPGKGWEYMVYDKADRLVMTQDANMKPSGNWLFTKYDKFSRVLYTGIAAIGAQFSRGQVQYSTDYYIDQGQPSNEERNTTGFTNSGMAIYYGNAVYPTTIDKILSVNYYDTYPTYGFNPTFPTDTFGKPILTDNATGSNISTKSLPVMGLIKNIEDDNWTKNYTYYDTKGRVVTSHSINHLGGYTRSSSELDFAGIVKQTIIKHKRLATDTERTTREIFTYDNQNRLLTHTHQVGTGAIEYLTQNKYNELSQLEWKKVGGTSTAAPLQQVDYKYNIRGWMTQINDPTALGTDLFGYKIKYNQVEGLETPNMDYSTLKVLPKFNGNIAEVDWKTSTIPNDNIRRYGYVYDNLNRLLAGFYQKDTNPSGKEYFEKMDYDLNGNITNLKRSADLLSGDPTSKLIDNLKYDYTGNKLTKVTDEQQNPSGYPYIVTPFEITYDNNGNMTRHRDKGIDSIEYNFLDLPSLINGAPGKKQKITSYIYRADGVKVSKIYFQRPLDTTTTDYLDGFQYEFYTDSVTPPNPNGLKFVPTSEGYYDFEKNKYIYNYTDHLGNVRLSYQKGTSGIEVIEENNYYPFGLKHEGYNGLAGNPAYQYKYNGKELQETGMYDYGARMYMPDLGRWGVIDPLAEKSRRFTPYNYAINNPIRFIDPDGRSESDWIRKDGKWQYDANVTTVEQAQKMKDVDGFAKNGTVLANANINGGETGYVRLNEGGTTDFNPVYGFVDSLTDAMPMSLGGTWTTWTHENFFSFSGGNNDPDKETLNKLRPGDTFESNNMFEYMFGGYGRNTKLSGGTTGFQEALVQFGLDVEGIGNPFGKSSEPANSDTLSFSGSQAVGLNIYRGSGDRITGVGVKTQDIHLNGLSRSQKDSVSRRFNADDAKFNNQKDSVLRRIMKSR